MYTYILDSNLGRVQDRRDQLSETVIKKRKEKKHYLAEKSEYATNCDWISLAGKEEHAH